MLLVGPGFKEGSIFIAAFGVFENYTVARGIAKGSLVHREGQTLFDASSTLLAGIQRDLELLRYDYSYQIGDRSRCYGGGGSVTVGGRPGMLTLRPKGYCSIRFVDGESPDLIDLRDKSGFMTDAGPLNLYRRKAESHWLEILTPLLDFLRPRLNNVLILEHLDRVG
jgi:hypothetical protein